MVCSITIESARNLAPIKPPTRSNCTKAKKFPSQLNLPYRTRFKQNEAADRWISWITRCSCCTMILRGLLTGSWALKTEKCKSLFGLTSQFVIATGCPMFNLDNSRASFILPVQELVLIGPPFLSNYFLGVPLCLRNKSWKVSLWQYCITLTIIFSIYVCRYLDIPVKFYH